MDIFDLERIETPTGRMLLVTDDHGRVRALDWETHQERMRRLLTRHYGDAIALRERPAASASADAVRAYFSGDLAAVAALETATNGTVFQKSVWTALRAIPARETVSYGTLAKGIGRPAAVRAVGLANGANPIAIVVPCHRVIGSNASLTGYGGGIERKRWLLAHEGVPLA